MPDLSLNDQINRLEKFAKLSQADWASVDRIKRDINTLKFFLSKLSCNKNFTSNFSRSYVDASGNISRERFSLPLTIEDQKALAEKVLKNLYTELLSFLSSGDPSPSVKL